MDDILDHAIAHHQKGELAEAIALYEKSLAEVSHAHVQHLLGMAYLAREDLEQAEHYLSLAAAGANRGDYFFGHGNVLHALKRYGEAYDAFQKAVALDPGNAALWFNLANSARFVDAPRAVMAYKQALSLDPNLVQAFVPLAALMLESGDSAAYAGLLRQAYTTPAAEGKFSDLLLLGAPQAVFTGEKSELILATLESFPKDYAAHAPGANRGLAILFALTGNEEAALACLDAAKADDPDAAKVVKLVKNYLGMGERYGSDLVLLDVLLRAYPGNHRVLSTALLFALGTDNMPKAIELLNIIEPGSMAGLIDTNFLMQKAVKYLFETLKGDEDTVGSYMFLSRILQGHRKFEDSLFVARAARELDPAHTGANLQIAAMAYILDLDTAEGELEQALAHNPNAPELLNFLGSIKLRRGDTSGAFDYFARARQNIGPGEGEKHEIQLINSVYISGLPGQVGGDMHKQWGDALIARQKNHRLVHAQPVAKSRLRIGYVSGDFQDTSPSYFFRPLLENHDRDKVEVYLYNTWHIFDHVTRQVQRLAHWRDLTEISDNEAIALIREDDIDILVDMIGQNQGARNVIFARKAAPVQVTWMGYATTSGLSTIDYRFTDPIADPPGMTESYHAEKLYRLPHFLCYRPPDGAPQVVGDLPALETGRITFGNFNQPRKFNDDVLDLWAAILSQVENSRMTFKAGEYNDPKTRVAFQEKFARRGVAPERIQFYDQTKSKFDHLMVYTDLDLTLDPFPFNGTTTTFESLWMSVPMIALEGKVHAARVGCAILEPLGLGELIAHSPEEYIEKAVALAHDLPRLQRYRSYIRPALQASPLMDGKAFAASVESAYFDIWDRAVQKGVAVNAEKGGTDFAKDRA